MIVLQIKKVACFFALIGFISSSSSLVLMFLVGFRCLVSIFLQRVHSRKFSFSFFFFFFLFFLLSDKYSTMLKLDFIERRTAPSILDEVPSQTSIFEDTSFSVPSVPNVKTPLSALRIENRDWLWILLSSLFLTCFNIIIND